MKPFQRSDVRRGTPGPEHPRQSPAEPLPRRRSHRRRLPAVLAGLLALTGSALTAVAVPAGSASAATAAATTPIWSTQLDFDNNGTAWSESSFATLKSDGLTTAEINMPWNTIEPTQGTFTFTELDTELANAAAAGIQLIPIFWYSGWGGSPAGWVTSTEESSSGAAGTSPAWWDTNAEPAYLTYVTDTVKHIAGEAGYGGSILNFGFLDAQLDTGNGAAGGWATADVNEFHNVYLPQTYSSISAFNSANGTSYTAFSQVPAAAPGQALANVFQAFRVWSVQTVYGQLTADVRAVTSGTPLYYYFGGHIGNGVTYANIPDLFFALAKQYTVTVIEDAAQSPGLALLFGSLGRAYGVKVATEWTAPSDTTQYAAQAVQWIDNNGIMLPDGGGTDFFIHDGTQKDTVGFPIYINALANLKSLTGSYPQQPVAVYLDYSQAYGNASGGSLTSPEDNITNLWNVYQAGFAVVTSQEVDNGTVKLSAYKAILPINGVDANLTSYQSGGGTLLTANSQLAQYAPAYASLASNGVIQIVPDVSSGSAQLMLADITSGTAYNDSVTISPAGLGLASGTYHIVNAAGTAVPQETLSSGAICAEASLSAASLTKWTVASGAAPSGTATPSNCADSTTSTCGTLTANHELTANQSLVSCSGAFSLTMQGDGNLVLYQSGTALWATNTSGSGADEAILQGDGNLVLYNSSGTAEWASGTAGNSGAYLDVQNDGNLVIYSASGTALWASGTS